MDEKENSESGYEIKVVVPKQEFIQQFSDYILSPGGPKYQEKTEEKSIWFNPVDLVIDIYNQSVVEKHLNETPSKIWNFEDLLSRTEVLLESLQREEEVWKSQEYIDIHQKELNLSRVADRATEHGRKSMILTKSLEDEIGQLFWKYIGRSTQDVSRLKMCIKALTSHNFKCKTFYDNLHKVTIKPQLPID